MVDAIFQPAMNVYVGMTSCLRFPGMLDADLRKKHANLVPFKNAHFLCTSFAPLTSPASLAFRKVNILDLVQQMVSKQSMTIKCNPLNPGDPRENILRSRFLASFAAFRGNIRSSEVDEIIYSLQKDGSRFDKYFPDWIPNSISSSICSVPHDKQGDSVTFVSNTTAIHEVFDRIINTWDAMYKSRSHLHVFEQDGISTQDMMESRNILRYISDQYQEFARWEDKLFDTSLNKESTFFFDQYQEFARWEDKLFDTSLNKESIFFRPIPGIRPLGRQTLRHISKQRKYNFVEFYREFARWEDKLFDTSLNKESIFFFVGHLRPIPGIRTMGR